MAEETSPVLPGTEGDTLPETEPTGAGPGTRSHSRTAGSVACSPAGCPSPGALLKQILAHPGGRKSEVRGRGQGPRVRV